MKQINSSVYSIVIWARTIFILVNFGKNLGGECRKLSQEIFITDMECLDFLESLQNSKTFLSQTFFVKIRRSLKNWLFGFHTLFRQSLREHLPLKRAISNEKTSAAESGASISCAECLRAGNQSIKRLDFLPVHFDFDSPGVTMSECVRVY